MICETNIGSFYPAVVEPDWLARASIEDELCASFGGNLFGNDQWIFPHFEEGWPEAKQFIYDLLSGEWWADDHSEWGVGLSTLRQRICETEDGDDFWNPPSRGTMELAA